MHKELNEISSKDKRNISMADITYHKATPAGRSFEKRILGRANFAR